MAALLSGVNNIFAEVSGFLGPDPNVEV